MPGGGWLSGFPEVCKEFHGLQCCILAFRGGTIMVVGTGDHWVTAFHIPEVLAFPFLSLSIKCMKEVKYGSHTQLH